MKNPTKTSETLAATPNLHSQTAVRGKYYNRFDAGTNLVVLDPALMPYFPDSESVNRALHAFLAIGDSVHSAKTPPRRRQKTAPAPFDPRVGTKGKATATR